MTGTNGTVKAAASGRAIVVHPVLREAAGRDSHRSPEACLDEAAGLTAAIDLDVVDAFCTRVVRPQPGTLFGGGAVDSIAGVVAAAEPDVVVVDNALTPVQQRNLERRWDVKVIDRVGLILEIFGERARTREGQLQVELAHLSYQRSRLVRSWTHLERQRGGAGFMGGPGERQIELDRRLIDERIARLKSDLAAVRRTRGLHRKARERVPFPVIALVGYTNAGKSTLFNRLTRSSVTAKDLLFATLDPTMRAVELAGGGGGHRTAILSDTVGFISNLPTHLVAAFRATLEEVEAADIIVHVRDISHPESEAQEADVIDVLHGLGIEAETDPRMVVVLNKLDRLDKDQRRAAINGAAREPDCVAVSALTGEGCDELLTLLHDKLGAQRALRNVTVSLADGRTLSWLYAKGEIIERRDVDCQAQIRVALDPADADRLDRMIDAGNATVTEPAAQ